jgi:hypothetical protein
MGAATAQSHAPAGPAALDRGLALACGVTGCDAGALLLLQEAAVGLMTAPELRAEIAAREARARQAARMVALADALADGQGAPTALARAHGWPDADALARHMARSGGRDAFRARAEAAVAAELVLAALARRALAAREGRAGG